MKDINLIILNEALMPIDSIQNFTSLIWQQSYFDIGTFEVYIPYSKSIYLACFEGRFVMRDDTKQVGYIETFQEQVTKNNQKMLIISGYLLEGIMQKRVFNALSFNGGLVIGGPLIDILNYTLPKIITKASVSVVSTASNVPMWGDSANPNRLEDASEYLSSIAYASLEAVKCSLTHKMPEYGKVEFTIWQSIDHTISQNINPPIVLSENMGNISNISYQKSEAGCHEIVIVNAIYPSGTGYDAQSWAYVYNPNNYAIDDLSINHIGITSETVMNYKTNEATGVVTYYPDFKASEEKFKKEAQLQIVPLSESFTADLINGEIVSIGDIVTFRDEERGVSYDKRVEKYVESYNASKITYSATFGSPLKTTKDVLKKSIGLR